MTVASYRGDEKLKSASSITKHGRHRFSGWIVGGVGLTDRGRITKRVDDQFGEVCPSDETECRCVFRKIGLVTRGSIGQAAWPNDRVVEAAVAQIIYRASLQFDDFC